MKKEKQNSYRVERTYLSRFSTRELAIRILKNQRRKRGKA